MQPFQERVVAEREALGMKVSDLSAFMTHSAVFRSLPDEEKVRLGTQLAFMKGYFAVLDERIAAFRP